MNAVSDLAYAIRAANFAGENPFTFSQARDLDIQVLDQEFHPTSKYWSLLNNSNEVLIGTRGCGKSILLRMLCYSHYRHVRKIRAQLDKNRNAYYGIYIPLRLQLLNEIPKVDPAAPASLVQERRNRFRFVVNCLAAGSYLNELKELLADRIENSVQRLLATRAVIDRIGEVWRVPQAFECANLEELQFAIDLLFARVRSDWRQLDQEPTLLKSGLLEPILAVRAFINHRLGLEPHARWLACVDEAEYLQPDLQASINTLLRSAIPGLSVKVATLPLHWQERQTEIDGVSVLSGGDDFRFTNLDYKWDSKDFIDLSNKLVAGRIRATNIVSDKLLDPKSAFDDLLGPSNDAALIDVYRDMTPSFDRGKFDQLVRSEMDRRQHRRARGEPNPGEVKKYEPIILLRQLKKMLKGNTRIPLLSGPRMARRVSGGNVRRLIQICHRCFETARTRELNPAAQHDAVMQFAKGFCERAEAVDTEGFILKKFLTRLGETLYRTMHEGILTDVGLAFRLSADVFNHPRLHQAIRAGVAHSHIVRPPEDVAQPLNEESELMLANAYAAVYWLPMRSGTRARVAAPTLVSPRKDQLLALSESQAKEVVDGLQLTLFGREGTQ